jgi:organic hydroperoxide reductase OsmC/OhrA
VRLSWIVVLAAGCAAQATGYDAADPTKLTCPCDDAETCYRSSAEVDKRGENAQTGEQLLVLSQCACFEGSMAG